MREIQTVALVMLAAATFTSAQTFKTIHNFGTTTGDPTGPRNSGVIAQSRGGTMFTTADNHWTDQRGAAFSITPGGAVTVVHRFALPNAIRPVGGLTLAMDGLYYGTNKTAGTYGYGNVFKMKQGGGLTVLHTFDETDNMAGCSHPYSPPIQSVAGDFYGTAIGDGHNSGCIYRISASGQFTVLHTFSFGGDDGRGPYGALVQGSDFWFYGTTRNGGWSGYGTIFRISASGDFQRLWTFDGYTGALPESAMIQGMDGNFYGANTFNVFKMTPDFVVSSLHSFSGGSSGWYGIGGVVQATDGYLYGTTENGGANDKGMIYRVSTAGDFSGLHDFDGTGGANPQNTLMQHTNGLLYGTAEEGGTAGKGTFFSFDLGLAPFVTYLPVYGRPGTVVEILGQGFNPGSQVTFNGTLAAAPDVVYPTYLRVVVPSGATTGPITVTTDSGTLTSNRVFIVHPS